ncbi:MAG: nitrate/nitrite transporter NrtS [Gammaproteobacteria bacterium]|uniref:nitrate/nitrite transporter NrtS n=1 Tax=Rhodoferax sp. TaxID=50421 RepID=UPI0018308D43|nr:nitrate/nitrite transporter NrtS [Rhodoferax sp.]MBU3900313.1 nitrate/nitrite transporter NrtS [Gammaproteobacteria bacterium]MBA3058343.1 hypothetical protein [Rhodoferax sp.]MBU3998449.1 nitrate/nitrite transporter NrtS [Gammaproteobacteria bacterium]MBU4018900.1 nitrate/nitrite transporter NrtS [Gammaproteobacteria bacterium]MBU4080890.1 nitrate/nitrite transporter NrtS [Gammaproteobacteria bacterium]
MRRLLQVACSRRIVIDALKIALVVGTVLNIINQGNSIVANTGVSWTHVLLNYLVPYSVASYSAAKNQMTNQDGHDEASIYRQ